MSAPPIPAAVAAPFERPPRRRGVRGVLAGLVALGAIPVAFLSHRPAGGSGSESGGGSGYGYRFTWGQARPGTALVLAAIALLLLGAAAVLWRAHSRRLIAAATVAALAAALASVAVVGAAVREAGGGAAAGGAGAADREAVVSAAAVESVAVGTPRAAVVRRLGPPLTSTDARPTGPGTVLGCLVYTLDARSIPAPPATFDPRTGPGPITPGDMRALLCFAHDRFVLRLPG
jgi:hypothetical protein